MAFTPTDTAPPKGAPQDPIGAQLDRSSLDSDSHWTAIGTLIDPDLKAAATRLRALDVSQKHMGPSRSIADRSPQSILALFR